MTKTKCSPKIIFILCVAVISAALLILGLFEQQKVELSAALRGKWVKEIAETEPVWLELHVGPTEMEYRFASDKYPDYNRVLFKYRWRVVGKNQVWIQFPEGHSTVTTIAMTEEGFTFDPAVTTKDTPTETWVKAK